MKRVLILITILLLISMSFADSMSTFKNIENLEISDAFLNNILSMVEEENKQYYRDFFKAVRALHNYDRDKAYNLLLSLNTDEFKALEKELWFKTMELTIILEDNFTKHDSLVKHAVQLYEEAEKINDQRYMATALQALAYFDYYFYDMEGMSDKLINSYYYSNKVDYDYGLMNYYYGLSLIAIDENDYEEALRLNTLGFDHIDEDQVYYIGLKPASMLYSNEAWIYFLMEDYESALKSINNALQKTPLEDNDGIAYYANFKSRILIKLDDYEEALLSSDLVEAALENTNDIFEHMEVSDVFKYRKATILYGLKRFQESADLYYEIATAPIEEGDAVETAEAVAEKEKFNYKSIMKEVDLLKELQNEQKEKLELQNQFLNMTFGIIVLLLIVIGFIVYEIKNKNRQKTILYNKTITDHLTQIFSRNYIIEILEKKPTQAVALMDLDDFKTINDTYGHIVGDAVLVKVAETIKSSIRSQDSVGRYGGEEFLVVVDTDDMNIATEIIERIRRNVEKLEYEYDDIKTTLSIGLTMHTDADVDSLLKEADELLYDAKENGKNRVVSV